MNNLARDVIFKRYYKGNPDVRIKDFIDYTEPNDIIEIDVDETGWYSENNSWDPYTEIRIIRERPKTKDELEKEKISLETQLKISKQKRYETYLNLKKEFEND